jgi:hypothetical protein
MKASNVSNSHAIRKDSTVTPYSTVLPLVSGKMRGPTESVTVQRPQWRNFVNVRHQSPKMVRGWCARLIHKAEGPKRV